MKKIKLISFITAVIVIFAMLIFSGYYFLSHDFTWEAPRKIKLENQSAREKPGQIMPVKEIFLFTNKEVYGPGEEIKAAGIINNQFRETKRWTAVYYFMSEDGLSFSALSQTKELKLSPGETKKIEFVSQVSSNLPPGNYRAKLEVLEQEQAIGAKTQIIAVEGTNKILSAELKICPDRGCHSEKTVFTQNESIYIQANSEAPDLSIQGKIKYPESEERQDLDFDNSIASISADRAGSYEVVVIISKDKYQDVSLKKDFAVIESVPEIKSASKCNADGICENEENFQNCPQDCTY